MNSEIFLSNSDSNPLAKQWANLAPSNTPNPDKSNLDHKPSFPLHDSNIAELERLREQKRQLAAEEAEWERQEAEYEAMLAEMKQQDAEYEAMTAEMRRQEEEDELADTKYIFANIDFCLFDIEQDQRSCLNNILGFIGVYADVKPLAIDHFYFGFDDTENDFQKASSSLQAIQEHLQSLGITFAYTGYPPTEDFPSHISWYASKDPQLIQEWQNLQNRYHDASPAERDDITRREGQLLGYPATATEYFIAHSHAREADPSIQLTDGGVGSKFSRTEYVHSPDHAEEEYASYEKPLYAALQHYCPEYTKLLNQQIAPDNTAAPESTTDQ